MRKGLLCCVVGLLAASCVASDKSDRAHLMATVLKVQKHEANSPRVRKPTDAPLTAATYTYYVARYESSSPRPLPMFAPNRRVEVHLQKRVLSVRVSDEDEMEMSIVEQSATSPCTDR
jgi:hypothetical protein